MKRLSSLCVAVLLVLAIVSGCSSSNKAAEVSNAPSDTTVTSAPEKSPSGEKQEIHVFHFMVDLSEQFNTMTKLFEKEHPNIKIVNDIVGGGADWKADLKTRFASGKGPDIFVVDGPSMLDLWKTRVADLSNEPWVMHALPFTKETATIDGKLYGMPYNLQGFGLVYDTEAFKKAGISQTPKTLTELEAAAEKLKKSGVTPFGNGYGEWWILGMHQMNIAFAQQDNPGQFLKDLTDGKATLKGNPLLENYKNFLDLTLKYGNANPITTDYKTQETLLASGEVSMIHQGDWAEKPMLQINPNVKLNLMPLPINDDAAKMDRLEVGIPMFWVVNNESKYQDAAKEFLNWMVSSENGQLYLTKEFQFIPAYDNIPPNGLAQLSQTVLKYSQEGKTIPWSFNQWPDGTYNEFYAILQGYIGKQYDYPKMLEKMDVTWKSLSHK